MATYECSLQTKLIRKKHRLNIGPRSTGKELKAAVAYIPDEAVFDESFTDEVDGSQLSVIFHEECQQRD